MSFNFVMANIINLVPFSVFEVFVYLAILFVLAYLTLSIIFLIKKRRLKALHSFLAILLTVLVIVTTFFMSAGFSYAKTAAPVPQYMGDINLTQFKSISHHFLDDFNHLAITLDRDALGNVINPYTDRQLSDILNAKFNEANLDGLFRHNTRAKVFRSGRLMSEVGIGGVFFPPLSEANINAYLPTSSRPFVMAHEIAHARGIMREDFANEIAWYITLNSDNDFIRYSGYMSAFFWLIAAFSQFGEGALHSQFIDAVHQNVWIERQNNSYHWSQFMLLANFTNWINDLFLRIMGQEDGTNAYTPNFDFEQDYVRDPDTGNIIVDEDGRPQITRVPVFNTIQRVFFYIYHYRQ